MGVELSIKEQLKMISKKPARKHGQNFLTDTSVCRRIVQNINARKGTTILEIGPGLGILTGELLKAGYSVKALEIDEELVGHLVEKFREGTGHGLEVVNTDAVKFMVQKGLKEEPYLVSNLPYNLSSSLMGLLLDSTDLLLSKKGFTEAIIMFQKEFGERLVARPGSKTYGKISVMFDIKMEHEVLFKVPKDKFYPQPKVDGIVVRFRPREDPECIPLDDTVLKNLVTVAFMNRRKMLKNSIQPSSLSLDLKESAILEVLDSFSLSERRPETVTPCEMVELSNRLVEIAG
ncbi:MAG: ribosomal RNA small subunit methyltransferase A [Candidatus Thermoplasmatota archaeon]|nr:ribosomal RNA small subunit methyltransferase A [Candidatus Thermoplasmatota archaeon]